MNGYLLSVIGTVLLCSLLTAIAPEGKTASAIKGVARLACVLTIIHPVLRFFQTGSIEEFTNQNADVFFNESVIERDREFIQYYSETRVRATEKAMAEELYSLYGVQTLVTIYWSLEEESFGGAYTTENIRIEKISIDVPDEVSEEVRKTMSQYLTQNYCSEVLLE